MGGEKWQEKIQIVIGRDKLQKQQNTRIKTENYNKSGETLTLTLASTRCLHPVPFAMTTRCLKNSSEDPTKYPREKDAEKVH